MNNTETKHSLHLYLNDDENELLENKFKLSKAKSKSQFVRDLIVDGYIFDVDFSTRSHTEQMRPKAYIRLT